MLQADPVSSMQWDLGTVLRDADLKAQESSHSGITRIQGRSSLGKICKQKNRKQLLVERPSFTQWHMTLAKKTWDFWVWEGKLYGMSKVLVTSFQSPGGGYINPIVYDKGARSPVLYEYLVIFVSLGYFLHFLPQRHNMNFLVICHWNKCHHCKIFLHFFTRDNDKTLHFSASFLFSSGDHG